MLRRYEISFLEPSVGLNWRARQRVADLQLLPRICAEPPKEMIGLDREPAKGIKK
jgi:hypothetical protein